MGPKWDLRIAGYETDPLWAQRRRNVIAHHVMWCLCIEQPVHHAHRRAVFANPRVPTHNERSTKAELIASMLGYWMRNRAFPTTNNLRRRQWAKLWIFIHHSIIIIAFARLHMQQFPFTSLSCYLLQHWYSDWLNSAIFNEAWCHWSPSQLVAVSIW